MKAKILLAAILAVIVIAVAGSVYTQTAGDPLIEGFRTTEVASIADAIEQLYGRQNYMYHDMRALFKTKFAGPAVTVLMKKEEHKEGAVPTQGMIEAIDTAPAGSVYVMVAEDGPELRRHRGPDGHDHEISRACRSHSGRIHPGPAADPAAPISRIRPRCLARHYHRALSLRGHQHPGYLCGRPGESERHHRSRRGRRGGCAARKGRRDPQESPGTGLRRALDVSFIERFKSLKEAVAKFGRI